MDLSALTISFAEVLAMGLIVLTAYAGMWAVKKVVNLAGEDFPRSRRDIARELYLERESFVQGWLDRS